MKKFLNLGIVAHADAGKTTVTENILFLAGKIKSVGSVDKGTGKTDTMPVEKERGISVAASFVSFEYKDLNINLIDTPGHVDFSAETERSMRVLDAAVLVLSAAEGVQAHTETLWHALRAMNIPTIIFVNKIDRLGVNIPELLTTISKELSPNILPIQSVVNQGDPDADILGSLHDIISGQSATASVEHTDFLKESIAEQDENLLEKYLDDEDIPTSNYEQVFIKESRSGNIFPLLYGSAKNGIGIKELMNAITEYLPTATADSKAELSAIVYKIAHDKKYGKISYLRLYKGKIANRDLIHNATRNCDEKANRILKAEADKYSDISEAEAGDICGICGMTEARVGDIIGNGADIPDNYSLAEPLLTVKAEAVNPAQYADLAEALRIIAVEDPLLDFLWFKEEKELSVKVMGAVQIEILKRVLESRFGIEANFSTPKVIYKETPSSSAQGYEEYTMPKPCWAVIKFQIEPGQTGSGLVFESQVSQDKIEHRYQQEIKRTIPEALQQGIKGWEVTDLKITLTGGEHHNIHSRAGDFVTATPMALMNGLVITDTDLLEPILRFRVRAKEDLMGKIISDLTQKRAEFGKPEIENGNFILEGEIPLATSDGYAIRISSLTGGKGKFSVRFSRYKKCPLELGETREYKGISPLDRAKWILKARKALG